MTNIFSFCALASTFYPLLSTSRFILQMWHYTHIAYDLRTFNSIHLHIYTYIDSINGIRMSISRVSRRVQNRMSEKEIRGQNTIYILYIYSFLLFIFFIFFFVCMCVVSRSFSFSSCSSSFSSPRQNGFRLSYHCDETKRVSFISPARVLCV